MQTGILPLDKPKGFTSFDVIAKLRGITRQRKIGHAGTLDPMATGVLVCLFGNATRLCSLFPNEDKRYLATVQFGVRTDTQDITGKVIERNDKPLDVAELRQSLERFTGCISQVPPMVSAVSVGGKRLYDLARQGIEVERQPRKVIISSMNLIETNGTARTALLDVCCSKGTYIRTLADDIGKAMGIGASLCALRRTEACGFSLDDCVTIDWMQEHAKDQSWQSALRPVHEVFSCYTRLDVGRWQAGMLQNGVALNLDKLEHPMPGSYSVWCDGEFIGLATVDAQLDGMRLKKF